jgi:LacI family transcriptional regulator
MATIRDVAKSAGVSTATVSNVLNGRSERVSAETRERVLASVRTLKYRPTALEKNQKAILSQNLGVLVTDLTEGPLTRHGYFRDILEGALEASAMRGWSVTIFVQRMWYDVGQAVRRSYDGRCDGLIMVAPQPGNEIVQILQERGTHLVLVGSTPWLSNVSCVDIDNAAVGQQAARHLIDLKHRRLAYLSHGWEQVSSIERREAFFQEAKKAGIGDVTHIAVTRSESVKTDAEIIVDRLTSERTPPTGLFCWHDGLGAPLVAELSKRGYPVPEKFSVISVDDAPEATEVTPQLTTFANPLREIGKRAAKMIIDRLTESRETTEIVRFSSELIVRESTGLAPSQTSDPLEELINSR